MSEETASIRREFMRDVHPWQKSAWDKLLHHKTQGRLSHAQLFCAQPCSDLEAFALLFARYLLCTRPVDSLPCGHCRDCQLMASRSHPEFQEITYELNDKTDKIREVITVDQVRQIIDKVQKSSFVGACKVVMIHPAEDMMPAATNALLKVLEEPPVNTYFLLISFAPARLLATVRSRCQRVEIPQPAHAESLRWLETALVDKQQREELLAISGNNPVLARQWIDAAIVKDILATPVELLALLEGKQSPLTLAKHWQKTETEEPVTDRVLWWWRWLLLSLKRQVGNPVISRFELEPHQLLEFMQKLLVARAQLQSTANPNQELLLESLLIEWQNLRP